MHEKSSLVKMYTTTNLSYQFTHLIQIKFLEGGKGSALRNENDLQTDITLTLLTGQIKFQQTKFRNDRNSYISSFHQMIKPQTLLDLRFKVY